jgi:triphosphatase
MAEGHNHHPVETELKLLFPANARDLIDRHPALLPPLASPPEEQRLVSTYFDTSDLTLTKNGLSLRVRRSGDRRIQTVKSRGDGQGVASARGEWEWPIDRDEPDLSLLAETPIDASIAGELEGKLQPVLTTDVHRVVRHVRLEDGSVVEVAIDEGCLRAGDKEQPLRELELELKEGPVASLYRLALTLHADLPLRIWVEAKADQGYRLFTGQPPRPVKAAAPSLGPPNGGRNVSAMDGFRAMTGAAIGALLANQAAAMSGDIEGVHQMRVAVRRLRAVLVLFEPRLEPHTAGRFNEELRRLGRILGDARDWDVFCLESLPAVLEDQETKNWRHLLEHAADTERSAAHKRLRDELEQPAFTGLVLAIGAWIEDAPDLLGREGSHDSLVQIAPVLLDRIARKVAKRGRHIERLAGPELHAVRKSMKKLRYGVDDFADLWPHKRVKAWLKPCKRLLKLLGRINDASAAVAMGEKSAEDGHMETIPATRYVAKWSAQKRRKALQYLPDAWAEFQGAPVFWH